MKNIVSLKYAWLVVGLLVLASCEEGKYDREVPPPVDLDPGMADFSTYVSLGNSLTAGLADGALFQASQMNSFPLILSEKMSMAGGGEFTQPYMDDNVGGLLVGGEPTSQGPRLYFDGAGLAVHPGTPSTEATNIKAGPYNNMAVPGAKSFHLLANGYGNAAGLQAGLANPYFVRMASSPNASVLEDAMAMSPSFFSLWIGANDVLGYAYSGADGSDPITDPALFQTAMQGLIGTLISGGAKGIVGNIPDVTKGGFFTAVPYAPLDPTNPAFGPLIPLLNETFAQLNQAYAFLGVPERSIVFSETEASPIVIHDESLADLSAQLTQILQLGGADPLTAALLGNQFGQSRQATMADLITLPSQTVIASINQEYMAQLMAAGVPAEQAGQLSIYGITYPMPDTYVLIPSEIQEIDDATNNFNEIIKQLATGAGLAYLDAYALINQAADGGYHSNGFTVTTDFLTGGLFSLDGLHLTARGNAIIANEMMKAIDETYDSNFEEAGALIDIGQYPVFYPLNLP